MNSAFRSNNRAHARRRQLSAPAEIETFESRLLLTTVPGILTPTGTVSADAIVDGSVATVQFSWEAVDNAVSYDLWVSSLESFERIDVPELQAPVQDTKIDVPVTSLTQGRLRVWARANLAGGGVSAWSSGKDFQLQVTPAITGPVGSEARHLTPDATPEIQWASSDEVRGFQLWMTDVTTGEVRRFSVDNLTPTLDANGDPVLDANGQTILQEVRSFEIPADSGLPMGRFRVWVRSLDQNGAFSGWSKPYTFDAGPPPENLTPANPTFFAAPLLQWDAVPGATEYEVLVIDRNGGGLSNPLYQEEIVDTNAFQIPRNLATGEYSFWVRAIRDDQMLSEDGSETISTGGPVVYGAWSVETRFRTLIPPTVIGPTGTQGVVTELRPTLEWTTIHGAATYEVLVHKYNSKPPFLSVRNSATTLQMPQDLPQGSYTVWVRAIDTRGNFSSWSQPLTFETTGGRPVIIAPQPNEVLSFPTFQWIGRSDAASYTVWVSRIGVDFTYINVAGITDTFYQPIDPTLPNASPLPDGNYRIWVQAVFADGSTSPWSVPVDFVGGIANNESNNDDVEMSLVNLEVTLEPSTVSQQSERQPQNTVPAQVAAQQEDYAAAVAPPEMARPATAARADSGPMVLPSSQGHAMPADVLAELAEHCIETEWWASSGDDTQPV